jgi:beta-phosphoglucomutase-like phosphatase (HAD superfamily)
MPTYDVFKKLLHEHIGGSAHDTLRRTVTAFYQASPQYVERVDFDELHDTLNPTQDDLASTYVQAYEGLSELLEAMGRHGIKLGIFTSGTVHHIVRNFGIALPEIGLTTLYKDKATTDRAKLKLFCKTLQAHYKLPAFTVVTCEDVATHKPDPEGLLLGIQRLGAQPNDCMVFGDHRVDMQAGVNAAVDQRIGVTHGFDDSEALLAAGATDIVTSLPEFIARLSNGDIYTKKSY